MSFRKRTVTVVAIAVAISLLGLSPAEAAPITVKILGGPTDQFNPGANASWIGWSENSIDNPKHYDAFVSPLPIGSGATTKLNSSRQGIFGGITPDTNEAIFQQFNNKGSDLYVFNLTTMLQEPDPVGLNTSGWEAFPAISASSILFLRQGRRAESLRLYDRTSHSTIKLDDVDFATGSIEVGNVTEKYATWTKCVVICNVYFYDIAALRTHKVPNPNRQFFYAGSTTDATGEMYFVRSGSACGVKVKIRRWTIGSGATQPVTVASMPDGYDVLRTFTFNDGTNDNVYFDRLRCGGSYYSNIYEVEYADT
ncbi:MAG: hypothetical protein M3O98_07700 [Actinomycetota bacterium]|nr:hypothetical protein [Actinomycetota bacterium]